MTLKKPAWVLSVMILLLVILVVLEVNSFCSIGSRILGTKLSRWVYTPIGQLEPFGRGCILDLREAGQTYRRIAAHVGRNVSVVVAAFSSGL